MQQPLTSVAAKTSIGPARSRWRSAWTLAVFVGGLALLLRLLHLWFLRDSVVFRLPMGDGVGYDEWARRIVAGDWLGDRVFYQAPLYPYFLALIYKVLGTDVVAARVVQAFVGAASCVLLADAGRSFFGRRVGWIAGVALALYPTAFFFDGLIQKSVLDLFFLCATLCLLGRARHRMGAATCVPLGLAMGALVLTRENALLLMPVVIVWIGLRAKRSGGRDAITAMLLVALGVALVLLPVAIRNKVVGGEFHLTTSQMGPNLYIGNHEGATGTYEPLRPGRGRYEYERVDATELAEQAVGHPLTPAEVSAYWVGRVRGFVASSPGKWLGTMKTKAMLLVNSIELTDTEDQYTFANWSPVLRWSSRWFGFGVLIPLTVFGSILCWRSLRRAWVIHAMILVYGGSVIAFYVVARYRFPLTPMLILLAAAGVVHMLRRLRRNRILSNRTANNAATRRRQWVSSTATLGTTLALAVCLSPQRFTVAQMMAWTYGNIGEELARHPETETQAPMYFLEAIRLFPVNPHSYMNLATCFIHMRKWHEAIANANSAVQQAPRDPDAHYILGIAQAGAGRHDDAAAAYEIAVNIEPTRPEFQTNLGNLLVDREAYVEALPHLEAAVRLRPNKATYRFNLGSLHARAGRLPEAIESLREAIRLDANYADAHYNLAMAYRKSGRAREAVAALERYLELSPDDASARSAIEVFRAEAAKTP